MLLATQQLLMLGGLSPLITRKEPDRQRLLARLQRLTLL
jgi:hypothetical protein